MVLPNQALKLFITTAIWVSEDVGIIRYKEEAPHLWSLALLLREK